MPKKTSTTTNKVVAPVLDLSTLGKQDKYGRIFLSEQKKLAEFPDLLSLQKQGFESFINYYLVKLFDDINPIQDIA